MANITTELENIKNSVYGYEVRQSIHDAIKTCYDDAAINDNANMEVRLARGIYDTLNDRLGNNDIKFKLIDEQFNTKTDNSTVENLQTQVNNLVLGAVGDGNNAEVVQARTGEVYSYLTLNDRISAINDMLSKNEYKGSYFMSRGDIVNGVEQSSLTALRTDFIANNDTINIKHFRVNNGFKYKVLYYDASKTFVKETSYASWGIDTVVTYPYYRFVMMKTDETGISETVWNNVYELKQYDNFVSLKSEVDNLLKEYNNGKIKTVKDYGAKGDGVTNDWQAITNAINDCQVNEVLLFPFGTYLIGGTLEITKPLRINLCGSTIKTTNEIDNVIRFFSKDTTLMRDMTFENGTIDCGGYSQRGILLSDLAHFSMDNLTINNFKKEGIRISRNGLTEQCYEGFFDDIRLVGPGQLADNNTCGIFVDTSDCHFNNIIGTSGMHAVIINGWEGNFYSRVHGWFDYPSNRCLIKTFNECFITQCYSDSLPIGVYLVGANAQAKISQTRFLFPSNNENNENYYAIKFEDIVTNPENTSLFQCTMQGIGNNQYNFDTNKKIDILNTSYKNVSKNMF